MTTAHATTEKKLVESNEKKKMDPSALLNDAEQFKNGKNRKKVDQKNKKQINAELCQMRKESQPIGPFRCKSFFFISSLFPIIVH